MDMGFLKSSLRFKVKSVGVPEFIAFKNGLWVEQLMEDNPKKAKKLFDKYNVERSKDASNQNQQTQSKNNLDKKDISKSNGAVNNSNKSNVTINNSNKSSNNNKNEPITPRQPVAPIQIPVPKQPVQTKSRSVDTKDTGRSNVIGNDSKNSKPAASNQNNKRDLIMDQALKQAKLEHERRFNEKNKTNKNNNTSNIKERDISREKWAHEKTEHFVKREVTRVVVIQNSQQFNQGKTKTKYFITKKVFICGFH